MAAKASWHRNYVTVTRCIVSQTRELFATQCMSLVVARSTILRSSPVCTSVHSRHALRRTFFQFHSHVDATIFLRLNRVVPRRSRASVSGLVWSCLPRDETPTNALVWRAVAPRYAQTPSLRFAADLRHIYDSLYTANSRQVEILKFELSPRDVRLPLEWPPLFPGS